MLLTDVRYAADGWGVGSLRFGDDTLLHHELPSPAARPPAGDHPLVGPIERYFAGERVDFGAVEIDLVGATPFEWELTAALRAVPYGETVTYGELAALAGRPRAHRAAGSFCARNRFPLVVPCHRVVASSGLGGYGWLGGEYKRRLLALEGAHLPL